MGLQTQLVLKCLNSNFDFDPYQLCDSGQVTGPLCSLLSTEQTRHETNLAQGRGLPRTLGAAHGKLRLEPGTWQEEPKHFLHFFNASLIPDKGKH